MRLPLLLSLLALPGLAATNPVQAWTESRCPPKLPVPSGELSRALERLECLKKALNSELSPAERRWLTDDAARERALGRTREKLVLAVFSWESRMCEARKFSSRLDVATGRLSPSDAQLHRDQVACQSWVHGWAGHFADALRRADEAALKENLAALEQHAKPGPEPTLRLLAAAKLLSERVDPQQKTLADMQSSRAQWKWTVEELTHAWRLPKQLSVLRCRAHEQRGVAVPERCEERVRRALEAELHPVTQALTKAASGLPAQELRAAEEALAQQERAWAEEQAAKEKELRRADEDAERGIIGGTVSGVIGGTIGGGPAPDGAIAFGPGMERPVRLSGEPVKHTPEALAARVQGLFIVKFVIQPGGEVTHLRVIKPLPHMQEAILKAVATWRFKPVLHEGKPVAVYYTYNEKLTLPATP